MGRRREGEQGHNELTKEKRVKHLSTHWYMAGVCGRSTQPRADQTGAGQMSKMRPLLHRVVKPVSQVAVRRPVRHEKTCHKV